MSLFLSLTGVVGTELGLGDNGFIGDPLLLLATVASSTLLVAGEEGFVDLGEVGFVADPVLLVSAAASSALLVAGEGGLFSS